MNILVVGCSHKTTPVEIRERLAFAPSEIEDGLRRLTSLPQVGEGIILSTCNRVEIYSATTDPTGGLEKVKDFFCSFHGQNLGEMDPYLYSFRMEEAVAHIFKVASSLDSMIVGEPQILGQIKDAYQKALEAGATGTILNQIMHRSFSIAKKIRTETGIAKNAVSISFAAVELAKKIFEDLTDKTVLLIGAGEMIELAARHLVNSGIREVKVANRTYQRAVDLAAEFRGQPIPFDQIPEALPEADIVISSTGAPTTILGPEEVGEALKKRKHRPIFLIDIAVPRDIDRAVNDLEGAYLYDIDDLQEVVEANIKERLKESDKAMVLIEAEVASFSRWLAALDAVPTIVTLREKIEAIRQAELDKASKKIKGDIPPEVYQGIDALTRAIVNKILHSPLTRLKQESHGDKSYLFVSVVRDLFNLDTEDKTSTGEKND